jgi:hypothetical protein
MAPIRLFYSDQVMVKPDVQFIVRTEEQDNVFKERVISNMRPARIEGGYTYEQPFEVPHSGMLLNITAALELDGQKIILTQAVTQELSRPQQGYVAPFLVVDHDQETGQAGLIFDRPSTWQIKINARGDVERHGMPAGLQKLFQKMKFNGIRFDYLRGNGHRELFVKVTEDMARVEKDGRWHRALVEFDQQSGQQGLGTLKIHPVFLKEGREEGLEAVLMLALMSGIRHALGYHLVGENLADLIVEHRELDEAVEKAVEGHMDGVRMTDQWLRDFVRIKFRAMMFSEWHEKAGDIYTWFLKNHQTKKFVEAFEKMLVEEFLYHKRSGYRWSAAWIVSHVEFHGGVKYTLFGDKSIPNVLKNTPDGEEAVRAVVETFYGLQEKGQRWMLHVLGGIVKNEFEFPVLRQRAQQVLEKLFIFTPTPEAVAARLGRGSPEAAFRAGETAPAVLGAAQATRPPFARCAAPARARPRS